MIATPSFFIPSQQKPVGSSKSGVETRQKQLFKKYIFPNIYLLPREKPFVMVF